MPSETTIPVSRETLHLVKAYKSEFAFHSLDEAVSSGIKWARLWNYVDSEQRRTVVERVNNLEFRVTALEKTQN